MPSKTPKGLLTACSILLLPLCSKSPNPKPRASRPQGPSASSSAAVSSAACKGRGRRASGSSSSKAAAAATDALRLSRGGCNMSRARHSRVGSRGSRGISFAPAPQLAARPSQKIVEISASSLSFWATDALYARVPAPPLPYLHTNKQTNDTRTPTLILKEEKET